MTSFAVWSLSCMGSGEPERNWCLACSEDRPEDCDRPDPIIGTEAPPALLAMACPWTWLPHRKADR